MREEALPRPILDYPLAAFTDDRTLIDSLLSLDIRTNGDLLAAVNSEEQIRRLAAEIHAEFDGLNLLSRMCDIARVPGIGRQRAGYLVNQVGVSSMQALRDQDVEVLWQNLRTRESRLKRDVVSGWIAAAQGIELGVDPEGLRIDVRSSRRFALRRIMTFLGVALAVLAIALAISYVADRISVSAMAMPSEVPETVWTKLVGMLNLAALLRVAHLALLGVTVVGFLAIAVLGYAGLTNRVLRRLEELGGPEYRVFIVHLEQENARYSQKSMLVGTLVLLAGVMLIAGISFTVPGGVRFLSSILQEAVGSMRAGEALGPLAIASTVIGQPLLVAMRRRQRVLRSYPGMTPDILRRSNQSNAAELGIGLTVLVLWAALGIGVAVGLGEILEERISLPVLNRVVQDIRLATEDAIPQGDSILESTTALERELGNQARGYVQEDWATARSAMVYTQSLLLLVFTVAIYVLALATISTFAKAHTRSRTAWLATVGGILLTTVLIPFLLDFALRATPSLAHLVPYLAFGILLLGVLFSFAW